MLRKSPGSLVLLPFPLLPLRPPLLLPLLLLIVIVKCKAKCVRVLTLYLPYSVLHMRSGVPQDHVQSLEPTFVLFLQSPEEVLQESQRHGKVGVSIHASCVILDKLFTLSEPEFPQR